jgi:hypothetical protein
LELSGGISALTVAWAWMISSIAWNIDAIFYVMADRLSLNGEVSDTEEESETLKNETELPVTLSTHV